MKLLSTTIMPCPRLEALVQAGGPAAGFQRPEPRATREFALHATKKAALTHGVSPQAD
jgi:hypothetical protein